MNLIITTEILDLLRYRASYGDAQLCDHIKNTGNNSMYTSPKIQNELIDLCREYIQDKLIYRIKKANIYTVLADEARYISEIEQFSLCIRYTDEDLMILREDFLMFVSITDFSGAGIANVSKQAVISLGLDLNLMRGPGYVGASAMSGEFQGVQAHINNEYPLALYTHCTSHCLNLSLNDDSKVMFVRNTFGSLKECCNYFRISSVRSDILKEQL
ncbi:52 kDa repressor of the inhibitor of the protein kinase-like [Belonocnema kinseyi]|uniref:52 kDa repressor of the inhibitor of the protein kinase-like n=1 Tax=Belonocnema kinseyi TaxID=2817044 RepID=UPI00143DC338|nr:52 kDa repressor of the inhibitor of the protein kinase-like [Belonocnema kinseyi]